MRVGAQQGDTLDALCWRHYGRTGTVVEAVLVANPGVADLGPVLPHGTPIELPELSASTQRQTTRLVQLWD